MSPIELADTFVASRQILKSDQFRPTAMAEQYRAIAQRLGKDFSPAIRLLELLPVFLSGPRHAAIRRRMATGIAAARSRQQAAARHVIDGLPDLLTPGATVELMAQFVRPLWRALAEAHGGEDHAHIELVDDVTLLFDSKLRLHERLRINERIREFIESDIASAEQRLIQLGQNVLGVGPFTGTIALSLHQMFCANLDKPFNAICFPERFPTSALPVTDRMSLPHVAAGTPGLKQADGPPDAQSPGANQGADHPAMVRRCLLHSTRFSAAENDEALYGIGEHACLGRPISNTVWSMLVEKLAGLGAAVSSSELTLKQRVPDSDEDFLTLSDPFIRPLRLQVRISPEHL